MRLLYRTGIKRLINPKNKVIYNILSYNNSNKQLKDIPNLKEFINNTTKKKESNSNNTVSDYENNTKERILLNKTYSLETFGCQMNENDSEIIKSILNNSGLIEVNINTNSYSTSNMDIILFNTCAIRESAEEKVKEKLKHLKKLKSINKNLIVGVLGCMAERKKDNFNDTDSTLKGIVDLVVGPDSYRDLPKILISLMNNESQFEMNVQLSTEETYSDIKPVRIKDDIKAYISIMRGCNNMCSFCIVPYTRGKERSRDMKSIISEIEEISRDENLNIKEVILLGQNVNSYMTNNEDDMTYYKNYLINYMQEENKLSPIPKELFPYIDLSVKKLADGFDQIQKKAKENDIEAIRFSHLLFILSLKFKSLKFRFTSPHPKDFPLELLVLIKNMSNISKQIHLPLQSGSNKVLLSMKRLYSKETFIKLAETIRRTIPNVKISTDIIVGFCGESEDDFNSTLDVVSKVKFDQSFMFKYSMREKTYAHRKLVDDVPEDIKNKRLEMLIDKSKEVQLENNKKEEGREQIILVEGYTKKKFEYLTVFGKNDGGLNCYVQVKQEDNLIKGDYIKAICYKGTQHSLYCEYKERIILTLLNI